MRFILSRNILTNKIFQKFDKKLIKNRDKLFTSDRSYSTIFNNTSLSFQSKEYCLLKLEKQHWTRLFSNSIILRNNSTISNTNLSENVIDLTNQTTELSEQVSSLLDNNILNTVESTVASLQLSSNYTPIGWCVHYLDFLHSTFPWWGSIAIGTLILRIAMFPFVVSAQRSAALMNEILPEQAILKEKMNKARITGDTMEFARLSNESLTLFKRKGIKPIRAFLAPMAQMPVFVTFFLTLRKMANHPVESLKTGGLFWFEDLSMSDPFYALPIFTSLTLWLTLESSFRSGLNPNQTVVIKYGARAIPMITLLFTLNFESAILVYWCTNNFISLIQVQLLRMPAVRQFLNIPQIKVNPMKLDINKKSFRQHFNETLENSKINRLMEEKKSLDEIAFKKSGVGPLPKTFKYDPTKNK